MTRPERIAVLSIGLITGQWWRPAVPVALGLVSALATVTAVHRVLHARRQLAMKDASVSANEQLDIDKTPSS
jgi:CHASE2 domain-containing sensor protein